MELEPENPIVLYNTGILYNIRSEYSDAVDVLEKSIEKNKDNVYAYLALGDALERQKEIKKAIEAYQELLSNGTVEVHGLKEKIAYLEKILLNMKK
jgi:tetratricopeptide (TPR) repeat protein